MSDDTHTEEARSSLRAHIESMPSEELISDVRLKGDNTQDEEGNSSPEVDSEPIPPIELTGDFKLLCLELLKADHRRASYNSWPLQCTTPSRSSLKSPLNSKVVAFSREKDMLHQTANLNKRKLTGNKNCVFKWVKLSSHGFINRNRVEATILARKAPPRSSYGSAAYGFEQVKKILDTREMKAE